MNFTRQMLYYVADDNEISGFRLETRNKEISVFQF